MNYTRVSFTYANGAAGSVEVCHSGPFSEEAWIAAHPSRVLESARVAGEANRIEAERAGNER